MKHHIKNLSNIVIVFLLCMGLGFATQNKIVINGIILVFIIHWALYIPANIFKTENHTVIRSKNRKHNSKPQKVYRPRNDYLTEIHK